MSRTSKIPGFYKLSINERLRILKEFANLTDIEVQTLISTSAIPLDQANRMIENVIGLMPVTIGVAVNFRINKRDYLIPMAIEEPSVVAAASNSAKIARVKGGFTTSSTGPIMIGQIQLMDVKDPMASFGIPNLNPYSLPFLEMNFWK